MTYSETLSLFVLGCVACGSDQVTTSGDQPQTHRCHDCALTWLNTDTIRALHARLRLHTAPTTLRRAA